MNDAVKLQRQCVQLGSINCDSVSPALQMKVAAGALDKPQITGMVLQVLTTDRCALLIPPGCFFFFFSFRSCLCHCWWNETVPAAHSGWTWARLHLLQDGTSISTSTFSGVWWVIKNRTGRSLICCSVWGRTKWASVLVSDRTVRSRIHKGPASCSETDTVQLD